MSIDEQGPQSSQHAGWRSDPTRRHQYRYFDGVTWSDHVADYGQQSQDPLVAPPPQVNPATATPPMMAAAPSAAAPAQGQVWQQQVPAWQPQAQAWQPHDAAWQSVTPAGLSMTEAVQRCLRKYVDFSGRASRSEYWWFLLAMNLALLTVGLVAALVAGIVSENTETALGVGYAVYLLGTLGLFLPALGVSIRRLHDTDKSGAFVLLGLIPYVGVIIVLVLMAMQGTPWPNRYGQPAAVPATT